MQLSDVLHQNAAHGRIQRAMSARRMPHAYLFTGPEGIGKEMLAVRLATVLLCESPRRIEPPASLALPDLNSWQDACGRCVDCELMQAGNHPDFHRIHRTLNRLHPDREVQKRKATELGIDVIRHFLIDKAGLSPSRGRAKIFVIVDGDRLNANSQNAMLKTLEEPPEHSYIILLSTSGDLLLDTTRSRCHQIGFRNLPTQFVREFLMTEHGADAATANFLAELSQGSPGRASQLLNLGIAEHVEPVVAAMANAPGDPLAFASFLVDLSKKLAVAFRLLGKDDDVDDDETADLNTSRLGQTYTLAIVGCLLRDVQRMAMGVAAASLPGSATLRSIASHRDPRSIRTAIQAVASAESQIHRNAQAQLVFDVASLATADALGPPVGV